MSQLPGLRADPLPWLLSAAGPGVRYLVLRDLCDAGPDDVELAAARRDAHRDGPIAAILGQMDEAGFWVKPGPGYTPKYTSTVWSLILLAQLGARVEEDLRIATACAYFLDHALTPGGIISASRAPSSTADCLHGNMCWSLVQLGCQDERIELAYDWLARSVTGEGIAPASDRAAPVRYYAGKCGPNFACGSNDRQPCAWGAVKVMLALAAYPASQRTPLIARAIDEAIAFLLAGDPALAAYPSPYAAKPSRNWWKFGFPVFYITDLLQIVEALAGLGLGRDPRLAHAIEVILQKQDADGRWPLEFDYRDKTWGDYGRKRSANPWVTLRALRVLKAAS